MKRNYLLQVVSVTTLFLVASVACGQTARDSLEMLRSDLKMDRTALIAERMALTPTESEAFWPIYRNYRTDVEKVTDGMVNLVLEYADLYPSVADEKAAELLKKYGQAEANLLSVKRKYVKKFGKVLPASKVFRFMQLDNRYDLGIRVGLASVIPILGQEPPPAADGKQ